MWRTASPGGEVPLGSRVTITANDDFRFREWSAVGTMAHGSGQSTETFTVTGNAATQVTRTVTVTSTDVSLPVISLNGPEIVYLNLNDTYNELGAVAYDGCDPNLPAVTVDNSAVNTAAYGEYTVTYNVTDRSSNAAVEVTRAVRVGPTLTLSTSGLGLGTPWRRWWQAQYNVIETVSAGGTPSLPGYVADGTPSFPGGMWRATRPSIVWTTALPTPLWPKG